MSESLEGSWEQGLVLASSIDLFVGDMIQLMLPVTVIRITMLHNQSHAMETNLQLGFFGLQCFGLCIEVRNSNLHVNETFLFDKLLRIGSLLKQQQKITTKMF